MYNTVQFTDVTRLPAISDAREHSCRRLMRALQQLYMQQQLHSLMLGPQ